MKKRGFTILSVSLVLLFALFQPTGLACKECKRLSGQGCWKCLKPAPGTSAGSECEEDCETCCVSGVCIEPGGPSSGGIFITFQEFFTIDFPGDITNLPASLSLVDTATIATTRQAVASLVNVDEQYVALRGAVIKIGSGGPENKGTTVGVKGFISTAMLDGASVRAKACKFTPGGNPNLAADMLLDSAGGAVVFYDYIGTTLVVIVNRVQYMEEAAWDVIAENSQDSFWADAQQNFSTPRFLLGLSVNASSVCQ